MSQKTNPIIFRLGIKNNWKSNYFEKKPHETKLLSFTNLEISQFVKLFLKKYGLNLTNFKLYLKKNSLNLFIVYNIFYLKFQFLLFKHIKKQKLRFKNIILKEFFFQI